MEIAVTRFGLPKEYDSCLICLPGRGGNAMQMTRDYQDHLEMLGHRESAIVGMQPKRIGGGWYPAPNGPDDQDEAITGMAESVAVLDEAISKVEKEYGITRKEICLAGFSAGAVMAMQMAATSVEPFGGVIVHSGAILDLENLPPAPTQTPILLCHYKDDSVFGWTERYEPMHEALVREGYNISTCINPIGGHKIDRNRAGGFILEKLRFKR